ncbi:MAG: GIY-YIG nuclease family protein [Candidatus Peribacteraceae bacterium]|nr:GIY-YIG nuclease family protein [Candidatus Peribacteraceae bacterium]
MFIVYVLRSTLVGHLYVGFTENLDGRVATHNRGEVISTKAHRPWKLIFHECYTNKADALRREQYLKTTAGKRGLKMMLQETLACLS